MSCHTRLLSLPLLLMSAPWLQAQAPEERVVPAQPSAGSAMMQAAADFLSGERAQCFEFERQPPDAPGATRAWVSADYMVSWLRGTRVPPLATGSSAITPKATAGVIGQPDTFVLLGVGEMDTDPHSGIRVGAGLWLSRNDRVGIEANAFFLESRSSLFNVASSGAANSPSIGRPFVDANTAKEAVALTAFPRELAGSIAAGARTDLWGTEANLLYREEPGRFFRTTFLAGFRYLDMDQDLIIHERSTPLGTATIPFGGNLAITNPDGVRVTDAFRTSNSFFGPQIGARTAWDWGRFSIGAGAKLALGMTHQSVEISGRSDAVTAAGQPVAALRGGLLANSGNIGRFTRNPFGAVPEAELRVEYRITNNLSTYVSGNFLYWSDVLNSGDQVTRTVNLARVPTSGLFNPALGGPASTTLTPSNFYANTIQLGFCLKF